MAYMYVCVHAWGGKLSQLKLFLLDPLDDFGWMFFSCCPYISEGMSLQVGRFGRISLTLTALLLVSDTAHGPNTMKSRDLRTYKYI